MINNISWTSYWQAIAIILAIYYPGILYFYYRKDAVNFFARSKDGGTERTMRNIMEGQTISEYEISEASTAPIVFGNRPQNADQAVMDEMKAYFLQVTHSRSSKETLIHSLQAILKKHPNIVDSAQAEMYTLIREQAAIQCSIILTDEDMEQVWLGL